MIGNGDSHNFVSSIAPMETVVSNSILSTSRDFGQVYFIQEEVAQQAIELFHDDLIKYFTM